MFDDSSRHTWQAEDYHNHSSAQSEAATQLLKSFSFKGCEQVLDIGCGDGKITAKIADFLPEGAVLGIDISPEMIAFAQKRFLGKAHKNLTFLVQDAHNLDYTEKFDIIFSSFALQWIPNQDAFFKAAAKSLTSSGIVIATIPLGISSSLEKAIDSVISSPKWAPYFLNFSKKSFLEESVFESALTNNHFRKKLFSSTLQETIFSSREDFENYVLQWFVYLHFVPKDLGETFFKQIIDKYLELTPPLENGKISFSFPRLDIIALKNSK